MEDWIQEQIKFGRTICLYDENWEPIFKIKLDEYDKSLLYFITAGTLLNDTIFNNIIKNYFYIINIFYVYLYLYVLHKYLLKMYQNHNFYNNI